MNTTTKTLRELFVTWKEHTTALGRLAAQYRKAAGRWSDGSFIVMLARDSAKQRNAYAAQLALAEQLQWMRREGKFND